MENDPVIIIRTDASVNIGSGHVIRCLTLAEELKARGAMVIFICRELEGNLISLIRKNGFKVHVLPYFNDAIITGKSWDEVYREKWCQDAQQTVNILTLYDPVEWVIVDHYALDYKWEQCISHRSKKMLVIDDLLDRKHDCHILLDQNVEMENHNYEHSLVNNGEILSGGKYIILRKIFIEEGLAKRHRDGIIRRIMLFFGGGDANNETVKALQAVSDMNLEGVAVDVVVGESNPHKHQIQKRCIQMGVNFYCQIDYIHELMDQADLFIGACGTTTWERFCLGLPGIVVSVADNQVAGAEILAKHNLLINLGRAAQTAVSDYLVAIASLMASPQMVKGMGMRSKSLIDGFGTMRIVDKILDNKHKDREV